MRVRDREVGQRLESGLVMHARKRRPLPGIGDASIRNVFIEQLVESTRRVRYVSAIGARDVSPRRSDPNDSLFDPIRAAILHQRAGNHDEACWLVFLFVHFGKHRTGGWRYIKEIYGRLGGEFYWDWANVSANPSAFREWLQEHRQEIQRPGAGFGNHRKYQSLDAYAPNGTGDAVESYVDWVAPPRTHEELFSQTLAAAGGDQRQAFDKLYVSMAAVRSFGRLARFDYLTMISKLGLAPIVAGSTYMEGSTGPIAGARLLFGRGASPHDLDQWLLELDADLRVGMQVLEDALCNWQKSPGTFRPFRD